MKTQVPLAILGVLALASVAASPCKPNNKVSASVLDQLLVSAEHKPGLTTSTVEGMLKNVSTESKLKQPALAQDYLKVTRRPPISRIAPEIQAATSIVIEDRQATELARGVYCDLLLDFIETGQVPDEQDIIVSVAIAFVKGGVSEYEVRDIVDEVESTFIDLKLGRPLAATLDFTKLLLC